MIGVFKRRTTVPKSEEIMKEMKRGNVPAKYKDRIMREITKNIESAEDRRSDQRQLPMIKAHVDDQNWPGLTIGQSSIAGKGVFTTMSFAQQEVVCDYHGRLITNNDEIREIEGDTQRKTEYMMFFNFRKQKTVIDATEDKCLCHDIETFGRLINHSNNKPTVIPKLHTIDKLPVILFHALNDLQPHQELLFGYNDSQSDLDWLQHS